MVLRQGLDCAPLQAPLCLAYAGNGAKDAVLKCMEAKRDALIQANTAQRRELVSSYTAEVSRVWVRVRERVKGDSVSTAFPWSYCNSVHAQYDVYLSSMWLSPAVWGCSVAIP